MNDLKRQIAANARRAVRRLVGSDRWLKQAPGFRPEFRLSREQGRRTARRLFEELGLDEGYQIEAKAEAFQILLANFLQRRYRHPTKVSLNRSYWNRPEYQDLKKRYDIIGQLKALQNHELIKMKTGYQFAETGVAEMARAWPTGRLLKYFPEHPTVDWQPVRLIEVRDGETGRLRRHDKASEPGRVRQLRQTLKIANRVNGDADIRHPEIGRLNISLIAIFQDDFNRYGRLHTSGPDHYQGLGEDERARLTINGEPVVELDFSGMFPYLLYAAEGRQFFGDPYQVGDTPKAVRPFFKRMLLALLNSGSWEQAEKAVNKVFYAPESAEERSLRRELKRAGIHRAAPWMKRFTEAHGPISGHFCSGKEAGLKIINRESRIAGAVVNHFARKRVPVLAIHDGFIIGASRAGALRRQMQRAFARFGNDKRCPIKQTEPSKNEIF